MIRLASLDAVTARLRAPPLLAACLLGLAALLALRLIASAPAGSPPLAAAPPATGIEPAGGPRTGADWLAPGGPLALPDRVARELEDRRFALVEREEALAARAEVLAAAEARIEGLLGRLEELQGKLRGLLDELDEEEEARLASLARVYEAMRPKEAARIFDRLEMAVLLPVVKRMREIKTAPIIANMETARAQQLTRELARQHDLAALGAGG